MARIYEKILYYCDECPHIELLYDGSKRCVHPKNRSMSESCDKRHCPIKRFL